MMVRGDPSNPEFQIVAALGLDDWDRWNADRDRRLESAGNNVYNRYVSPDVYGAESLEGYGRWVNTPDYGNVWTPQVAAGWAPYRDGRWVWEDYYGWTWVSYDPWGWAPYHYGRWFFNAGYGGWCWWPGSIHARALLGSGVRRVLRIWRRRLRRGLRIRQCGLGAAGAVRSVPSVAESSPHTPLRTIRATCQWASDTGSDTARDRRRASAARTAPLHRITRRQRQRAHLRPWNAPRNAMMPCRFV